ncbi:Disease resistance protein Piks-2-like protein [Drosera capensis]
MRYIVVFEDVWTADLWEDVRCVFPITNRGSKLIMTTGNSMLAASWGALPTDFTYNMKLLNRDDGWKLLSLISCSIVNGFKHK